MPKRMKPEKLRHLDVPEFGISVPRHLPQVESLKVVYDAVQDKYKDETNERRRELFIEFALTFITIAWLPRWAQPVARPVLRWAIGLVYDTIHNIVTR